MVPSCGISSATAKIFLLCVLLTGCGPSRSFVGEIPATSDQSSHPVPSSEEPILFNQESSSPPADASSSMQVNDLREDAVIPWFATATATEQSSPLPADVSPTVPANAPQTVWGIADIRCFPIGQEVASNGVEYNPLFLLDLDFNLMLWREQRVYLFADTSFWAQKAAPGITNAAQGAFDFSKREFDFNLGAAWNYAGQWEARLFAYSFNNLNRGNSQTSPSGFNDGIGIENRYYVGETYSALGTAAFDEARATFLSVGYYPSKSMVDGNGNQFRPGAFARAYLTCDLWDELLYLYGDFQLIAAWSFSPMLFNWDAGLAARPFSSIPRLEFRVGTQDMLDLHGGDLETSVYVAVRYVF